MKNYCLVCKELTDNTNSRVVKIKGRLMIKSLCLECKNLKIRFISQGSGFKL